MSGELGSCPLRQRYQCGRSRDRFIGHHRQFLWQRRARRGLAPIRAGGPGDRRRWSDCGRPLNCWRTSSRCRSSAGRRPGRSRGRSLSGSGCCCVRRIWCGGARSSSGPRPAAGGVLQRRRAAVDHDRTVGRRRRAGTTGTRWKRGSGRKEQPRSRGDDLNRRVASARQAGTAPLARGRHCQRHVNHGSGPHFVIKSAPGDAPRTR
jgi:hypothetical protein